MYIIDLKKFKTSKDFPKKGELKRLLIQQTVDLHDGDITEAIDNILYNTLMPYMSSSELYNEVKDIREKIIDTMEDKAGGKF